MSSADKPIYFYFRLDSSTFSEQKGTGKEMPTSPSLLYIQTLGLKLLNH